MSTETTKDLVIEMIRQMPSDATVADIMAELYFRQKVDEGLRRSMQARGSTTRTLRSVLPHG